MLKRNTFLKASLIGVLLGWGGSYGVTHFLSYGKEWRLRRFLHVPLPAPSEHALGDPRAPVCIRYYFSLTCQYCRTFQQKILPLLLKRYVNTGKLYLVFCEFPEDEISLQGFTLLRSLPSASYFWILEDILAHQDLWQSAPDVLVRLFEKWGLSEDQQKTLRARPESAKAILFHRFDAEAQWNLSATPSFMLHGKVYSGTFPWAALEEALLGQ
ncbi:MAG: DsbA family protein [Holosporales bacterium]|jgi:protein-disulfide isomerase|nr:DsbA family protein [Holosporales bacterium]